MTGIIKYVKWKFKEKRIAKRWRKLNIHNNTIFTDERLFNRVKVLKWTYGTLNIVNNDDVSNIQVGSFCSIADKVTFVIGAEHRLNSISTFPFKTIVLNTQPNEALSKGDIIVDDDVWIGYGSTIMSGVHIGQGAVVAAGAVVTKDVPPYAIVGGVPAKVIKYRFEPEMIEELLKVDYGKLTKEMVEEHIDDLYTELKDKKQIDWMPRKI